MANERIDEKTPLLLPVHKPDVVVKIAEVDYDINNNGITTSLTYEELLPFIIDPSWIHLRKICSTTCLIAFVVIFLAACISAHTSMTKMTCGVNLNRSDNSSAQIVNATEASHGILSIIIDGFNTTVPS